MRFVRSNLSVSKVATWKQDEDDEHNFCGHGQEQPHDYHHHPDRLVTVCVLCLVAIFIVEGTALRGINTFLRHQAFEESEEATTFQHSRALRGPAKLVATTRPPLFMAPETRATKAAVQQPAKPFTVAALASNTEAATTVQQSAKLAKVVEIGSNTAAETPANRTIVILSGNVRGGEASWQSLYKNVLDVNNADLAMMIGEPNQAQRNSSLFDRAKYVWTVPEYDDWADALELIPNKTEDWREKVFGRIKNPSENILLGGANGIRGSGALVFMFRFLISQKIQELGLTEKYDRFVITRTDHFYECPYMRLSQMDPKYIWVPEGEDYLGICDRHFIANSTVILKALDILPPLLANPDQYHQCLTRSFMNTEMFLKLRWQEEGLWSTVHRYKRNMFIAATKGDTSRWSPRRGYSEEAQAYYKYQTEFRRSKKTCARLLATPALDSSRGKSD